MIPNQRLRHHMKQSHFKDGVYSCNECLKEFPPKHQAKFLFHLTKEHGLGEYRNKCDQCDKVCDTRQTLSNHKRDFHEKKYAVVCDKCGITCRNPTHLNEHVKKVHKIYTITKEETIKKCDKCNTEFEVPELFNAHLKQCLDECKDFKCKFCDSYWVSHLSLWQHIAVNHKMLQYVCDTCGLISSDSSTIVKHKKAVHEKQFDYVCHICAKGYSRMQYFKVHMVTAHQIGERRFKCDQCDKSFARNNVLKQHYQRLHSQSSTLFQCELCSKTFGMKTDLDTHVRMIHDKVKPNKCDICQEGFYYKRDVISHKKHVHNVHE